MYIGQFKPGDHEQTSPQSSYPWAWLVVEAMFKINYVLCDVVIYLLQHDKPISHADDLL